MRLKLAIALLIAMTGSMLPGGLNAQSRVVGVHLRSQTFHDRGPRIHDRSAHLHSSIVSSRS